MISMLTAIGGGEVTLRLQLQTRIIIFLLQTRSSSTPFCQLAQASPSIYVGRENLKRIPSSSVRKFGFPQ